MALVLGSTWLCDTLSVRTPFEIPHFHVLPLVELFTLRRGNMRATWR